VDQAAASQAPRRGLITTAALAIVCWGITAFFFFVYIPSHRCRGDLCGLGLILQTYLLVGIAILLSAVAGAWALGRALRERDWLSAASFGILIAAAAFAAYALWYNGHPGHPLIALVYGFPPADGFDPRHPVAQYGSAALIPAVTPVLGLWVAIRIAG
jgi:hypothetical protein